MKGRAKIFVRIDASDISSSEARAQEKEESGILNESSEAKV